MCSTTCLVAHRASSLQQTHNGSVNLIHSLTLYSLRGGLRNDTVCTVVVKHGESWQDAWTDSLTARETSSSPNARSITSNQTTQVHDKHTHLHVFPRQFALVGVDDYPDEFALHSVVHHHSFGVRKWGAMGAAALASAFTRWCASLEYFDLAMRTTT